MSHIIYLSHNEVRERQVRGTFCEFTEGSVDPTTTLYLQDDPKNQRQGVAPVVQDFSTPFECVEQHRWMDLDGDGYKEPYIVTIRLDTKQVLRIVARFTREDISWTEEKEPRVQRIEAIQMFTKYSFIPSPDGGFYDLGFGALLGPINASIDTCINQMLDAGALSTAGGGFLGRGFKAKKGDLRFRLNEWKQVDCTGDDLRKSIFPLPTREPSPVLFNLLTLLIDYGQQVAGAADILQGKNPGQNTPAETSRTMVEQGMKVFNGIYKRVHRAFSQELRVLYKLNKVFLNRESVFFAPSGQRTLTAFQADYSGNGAEIRPSADANYMSDAQRMQSATAIQQIAMSSPGFNLYEVNKRVLEALKEPDIDLILPDPKGPEAIPPKIDPKVQVEQMKTQIKEKELELKKAEQEFEQKKFQMEMALEVEKEQAEISKIRAEIMKLMAEAKGVGEGHRIAEMEARIGLHKAKLDGYLKALELVQRKSEEKKDGGSNAG